MISVIISTKNGSKYIARALDSVFKQKDVDFEVIVVSDGSTDNTADVVRNIATTKPNLRLIELKQNIGPGAARNLAILGGETEGVRYPACTGEYIAIIDDDDMWLNDHKLKNQSEYLNTNQETVLVGAQKIQYVRENGDLMFLVNNKTNPVSIKNNMLAYNPVITSSVLFRKNIFTKSGGFKKMYLAEDYDLWLRMGQHGMIANIADTETQYTVRESGASRTKRLEMTKTIARLVNEYRSFYPGYFKAIIKAYLRILIAYFKIDGYRLTLKS